MADRLYIGNRRFSSWSMRGWLAVREAGLQVKEVVIPLAGGRTPEVFALPGRSVPYLEHDGNRVWESLAVVEYCAELHPALWPADRPTRTRARVIASEMHAGFRALRMAWPMDLGIDGHDAPRPAEVSEDVARIETLWRDTLARSGGPFLFGAGFTGADCMFAPVVTRFLTYGAPIGPEAQGYCQAVRAYPAVAAWYAGAAQEPAEWAERHG